MQLASVPKLLTCSEHAKQKKYHVRNWAEYNEAPREGVSERGMSDATIAPTGGPLPGRQVLQSPIRREAF